MSQAPIAGRNDAATGLDVYATSRANELQGRNPEFAYEWKSKDPAHPQYAGNYLKRRERGNQIAGYVLLDPWEVVTDGQVDQGRKRADDGKSVDTSTTHGSMILMRTPIANAEKERAMNERMTDIQSKALEAGERDSIGKTLCGARVLPGDATATSAQLTGGK